MCVAFESDAIDTRVVWDPYHMLVQETLKIRTLDGFNRLPVFNFYEVAPRFVGTHPRAVNVVPARLRTVRPWVNQHP